jgi:hypothetical protein
MACTHASLTQESAGCVRCHTLTGGLKESAFDAGHRRAERPHWRWPASLLFESVWAAVAIGGTRR